MLKIVKYNKITYKNNVQKIKSKNLKIIDCLVNIINKNKN